MNSLIKLPILLIVSILGAPFWMILRTWYGLFFFFWMMGCYGALVLSRQLYRQGDQLVQPAFTDNPLAYLYYEYTLFFADFWMLFIGYQCAAFCLHQLAIILFNQPKPPSWSMGHMLFGEKTPPTLLALIFFGILAFFSLRYVVLQDMQAGPAIMHGMTVFLVGMPAVAVLLVFERINKGIFPIQGAASIRNRSRISQHGMKPKETLSDIFSRRDPALKHIAGTK